MKKIITVLIILIFILNITGCDSKIKELPNNELNNYNYIVLDVNEKNLIVAEINESDEIIEAAQYSVPNLFYSKVEIKEGYKISISHNGVILETFPMQFSKIYKMEYCNESTGIVTRVIAD